jgi:putative transposase
VASLRAAPESPRRCSSSSAREQGLSAASITRLTAQWQDEAKAFQMRDLSGTDYVYLWVDGIHFKVRLEQEKLCLLVMIGVRAGGRTGRAY